jgi:hypothetical protein
MNRTEASSKFPLGSSIPAFRLQDSFGSFYDTSFFAGAKGALVVFTCNHCPYVKGSDQALFEVIKSAYNQNLRTILISANDPEQYPEDSLEKMREKAEKFTCPCPYLFDEKQEVARLFDAQCTPECYLFDRSLILRFHGAINDSPRDPSKVTKNFLQDAVNSVLKDEVPTVSFAHPIGCSIKWR